MPAWDIREIRGALLAKGFRYDPNKKRPHDFLRLCLQDGTVTSVRTMISKGRGEDVGRRSTLFKSFKRELYLTGAELEKLFNCPMTGDDYLAILLGKGIVRLPG